MGKEKCPYCRRDNPEPLLKNNFIEVLIKRYPEKMEMLIKTSRTNPPDATMIQNCPRCGRGAY